MSWCSLAPQQPAWTLAEADRTPAWTRVVAAGTPAWTRPAHLHGHEDTRFGHPLDCELLASPGAPLLGREVAPRPLLAVRHQGPRQHPPTGRFDELPGDVLEQVILRSTCESLLALSRTCRTFTSAVRQERWSARPGVGGVVVDSALFLLRLHVAGFVVLVDALPTLDPSLLARLSGKRFTKIFNAMDEDGAAALGDGKRRLCSCSTVQWKPGERHTTLAATLGKWYRNLLFRRGLLQVADPSVTKQVDDENIVAIKSLGASGNSPGCKDQPVHGDAGPPGSFTGHAVGDVPLSLLHSPADGESFLAYVLGCHVGSVDARRVQLHACDVAVMRGDFPHAGDSNTTRREKMRLHTAIDSTHPRMLRPPDETFPCAVQTPSEPDDPKDPDYSG